MHIIFLLVCAIMSSMAFAAEQVVLSIGEPIIDWIYYVDDSFLDERGLQKGGCIKIDWDSFTDLQSTLTTQTPHIYPGGSAANTLKGLAKLNHPCRYLGKVGKDALGSRFLESLQSYSIQAKLLASRRPTTQVISLVTPDGQRTMRCCFGASDELTESDLSLELFNDVKHVHIEGYTFYREKLLLKLLQLAKMANATISIDLASRDLVTMFKDKMLPVLKEYVDIMIANEDEARAITGLEPKEACLAMQEICPVAVVLVGENGCFVGSKGSVFASFGLSVSVVDTTGAGDLFGSGFLHGFLTNQSLETCAYFGNLTGSACVTETGAEIGEEKWKNLRGLMLP